MFGFGDDNKEKLQENMDEIKSMIENGESMQQAGGPPQQTDQLPQQNEEVQDMEMDMDESAVMESQSSPQEQQLPQQDQQMTNQDVEEFEQKFDEQMEQQSGQQPAGQPGQTQQPQSMEPQSQPSRNRPQHSGMNEGQSNLTSSHVSEGMDENRAGRSRREERTTVDTSIPEPAETKEINVPEIDKGPLFIRRQKFEYASQLIQEMHYLADQVEKTVNNLEADIQKDRETESQVREILQEFEDDRTEVERIVSPDKE